MHVESFGADLGDQLAVEVERGCAYLKVVVLVTPLSYEGCQHVFGKKTSLYDRAL